MLLCGVPRGEFTSAEWARLGRTARELRTAARPPGRARTALAGADGLLVDIGMSVSSEDLERAPLLRYIGVFGTGYAAVDVESAVRRGVTVTNIPGYATRAVAEFAIGAALAELRHLPDAQAGRSSDRRPLRGRELAGRRFGVVGLGRIGAEVARIASEGFGAEVAYWSRTRKREAERRGIAYRPLDGLLERSEVVSIHVALTEATRGLFDRARIGRIRRGALVLNFAPAALLDEEPLAAALRAGRFSYVIDHEDELSPAAVAVFRRLPNVRIYPPIGYETEEARRARAETFVSNIEAFLAGRPTHVVSAPPNR